MELYDSIGHDYSVRRRADLETGTWRRRYGHLLSRTELEPGYRLVVARGNAPG